jgi:hypothetical protein
MALKQMILNASDSKPAPHSTITRPAVKVGGDLRYGVCDPHQSTGHQLPIQEGEGSKILVYNYSMMLRETAFLVASIPTIQRLHWRLEWR